jgi:hypothetical protein
MLCKEGVVIKFCEYVALIFVGWKVWSFRNSWYRQSKEMLKWKNGVVWETNECPESTETTWKACCASLSDPVNKEGKSVQ